MFIQEKKRKKWPYVLVAVLIIVIGGSAAAIHWVKGLTPKDIFESKFVQETVVKRLNAEQSEIVNLMPILLGFSEPQTYLLVFQNNTELRPGGGFIGVYAVVKVTNGHVDILVVEGTEVLDNNTPDSWKPEPPGPVAQYLGTDRWYFRDSNWSPDYKVNALRAMEFYQGEGGIAADEIDAVVAVTPTVLERLMELTGPFTIDGIHFTSENVTEKLEYEVEYGFEKRGIDYSDRKQIIRPFMLALLDHAKKDVFSRHQEYLKVALELADEKHVMGYFVDPQVQRRLEKQHWTGELVPYRDDFVMWVDANLAALKTDHAMERSLKYEIFGQQEDGRYLAKVTMKYIHRGKFDWRTTRYLTYARAYAPKGSTLVDVGGVLGSAPLLEKDIHRGEELGRTWFGAHFVIGPGETKELSFTYLLPHSVTEAVESGTYTLDVEKQAGTVDHGLTLNLDFGITVTGALPEETAREVGDTVYRHGTDLRTDRQFTLEFE